MHKLAWLATVVPPVRGPWRVADSCKAISLSLLLGSIALGCGRSASKSSPAPSDGASDHSMLGAAAEVGADLASPDSVPLGAPDSADLGQDHAFAWLDVAPEGASWVDVGAELRMVDATTDGGDREAGSSPTSIDSASDGIAGIACGQLASAYSAFLATHRDCSSVSDCKVVGGAGTCNCVEMLGNGSGDAISATAVSDANAYFSRAMACIQQGFRFPGPCDAAPARNLRCEAGTCAADQAGCMMFGG